ncbi:MAG: hypothetical protein WC256_14625 [Desulfurivibrionaceae bacterium]|jgi:hypothetical protein
MIPNHDRLDLPGPAKQDPNLTPELKGNRAQLFCQFRANDHIRVNPASGNALKPFQLRGFQAARIAGYRTDVGASGKKLFT